MKGILFFTFSILSYFSIAQDQLMVMNKYNLVEIDINQLKNDFTRSSNVILDLGGQAYQFELKANDVLSPSIQRENPNILTFDVFLHDAYVGTLTWSEYGVWYYLKINGQLLAVFPEEPTFLQKKHKVEWGVHHTHEDGESCGITTEEQIKAEREHPVSTNSRVLTQFGSDIRTYRLYIATTGEFYELNGNAPAPVNAVITATVQGLNLIYLNDLSLKFTLSGQRVFTNSANDPFIPDEQGGDGRTVQAGREINNLTPASSYDIGHVLHKSRSNDGWSGGGLAQLNSVCRDFVNNNGAIAKASGWSGSFSNSGFSWLSLIAHEFGHQFGATHTFNGSGGGCAGNIGSSSSYEIGSGTTIMSYNGLCESGQNVPASGEADNYFHVHSLLQMIDHIMGVGDCAAKVPSNNALPTVTMNPCGATLTIPRSTPFYLNAIAEDADGDNLTYCWEQYDEDGPGQTPTEGDVGGAAAVNIIGPISRSFPPSPNSFRYFPSQAAVVSGPNSDPFDVTPSRGRELNYKLTVRDNKSNGAAIAIDDLKVTVHPSASLSVGNQSTWNTGDNVNITWNTGGVNDLCNNVKISLSIDGGLSYPFVLAENIAYSTGSLPLTVSGLFPSTSTARIKVECADFDCFTFYNINRNFRITSTCNPPNSFLCPTDDLTFEFGDPGLNLTNQSIIVGDKIIAKNVRVTDNSGVAGFAMWNNANTACFQSNNTRTEFFLIQVDKDGSYQFTLNNDDNNTGGLTIHENATYNPSSPCGSFVNSSIRDAGGGFFPLNNVTAELEACVTYRVVVYNFDRPNDTRISSITGPGNVIELNTNADPNFSFAYVAVSQADNTIVLVNDNPDFTTLPGGVYTIYAMGYKSGGPEPPNITDLNNYVGQTFNQFYIDNDCFLSSANSFVLTIEATCALIRVEAGSQGSCNPSDNQFTQDLILTYVSIPPGSEIDAMGQRFAITTSPQTITVSLPSDGQATTVPVFFTEEATCRYNVPITAPENCCPFDITVADTVSFCQGEDITLDAGPAGSGGSIIWKNSSGVDIGNMQTVTINTAGNYSVEVTNSTGCQKVKTFTVEQVAIPNLTLSPNDTICDGAFTDILATTNATTIRFILGTDTLQEGPRKELGVNMGGTYLVEAFFNENCKVSQTVLIEAKVSPRPDLGGDVFLCEGETAQLDGTSDAESYVWRKDGTILPETGPILTVSESGTYRVDATNDGGCTGIDFVEVLVEGIPSLTVSPDVTICDGQTTNLIATTNASLIKWYVDGDLVQTGSNTNYMISTGGVVTVEAGNSEACIVSEEIMVTANESPMPNLGFSIAECEGEEVRLSANADGVSYTWFRNGSPLPDMDSFLIVDQSGVYSVEVTNAGQCSGIDAVDVEFFPLPIIDAGDDITFCEGDNGRIEATSSSDLFFWFKDGVPFGFDLAFNVTEPGTYTLEARNPANCSVLDTIVVTTIPKPVFDLGDDKLACIGDSIELMGPDGDYMYQWFRSGAPVSTDQNFTIGSNGFLVLVVTDDNMCSADDNITVTFTAGPTLTLNQNTAQLCEGQSYTATVNTNASNVVWLKDGQQINGATGTSLQITEAGTYTARAEGTSGCVVEKDVEVTVVPVPQVDLSSEDMTGCFGILNTYTTSIPGNLSWTLNGNEISTSSQASVNQPGVLKLLVTNSFNCTNSDSIDIEFFDPPTLNLNGDLTFCEGTSTTLTAISNGTNFVWERNDIPIPGANSATLTITQQGTYAVTVTNAQDCENNEFVTVSVSQAPIVDLGDDQTLCPGESANLNAGNDGVSYNWNQQGAPSGSTYLFASSNPSNVKLTEVIVEVTNSTDCSTSDTILITELPVVKANITAAADGVCTGDSLVLMASGGFDYSWTGPNGSFDIIDDATIVVYPSSISKYIVTASDDCPGNEDTFEFEVDVFTPAEVSAGVDTCILLGRTYTLQGSGGNSYRWEDDPTIVSGANSATPSVMPETETTYKVTITDINGCIQEDEVTICVIEDPLSIFQAVTAITPNGDNMNDRLEFPGLEAFENNKLHIYNRWGNLIYEKTGYQRDNDLFDGTVGGDMLPADTYYYVLTFDEFVIKRTITIVREK